MLSLASGVDAGMSFPRRAATARRTKDHPGNDRIHTPPPKCQEDVVSEIVRRVSHLPHWLPPAPPSAPAPEWSCPRTRGDDESAGNAPQRWADSRLSGPDVRLGIWSLWRQRTIHVRLPPECIRSTGRYPCFGRLIRNITEFAHSSNCLARTSTVTFISLSIS